MKRTGTNYLRRLLLLNFSNLDVFASQLGWKHGMYHLVHERGEQATSHLDWLNKKTINGTVFDVGGGELKHTYDYYLYAISTGLKYIVSYKPLEYWISSMRFFAFGSWDEMDMKSLTQQYYSSYSSWLALPDVTVVNNIGLMNPTYRNSFLTRVGECFNLQRTHDDFINEDTIVPPCGDNVAKGGVMSFENRKMQYLNNSVLSIIPDTIWEFIKCQKSEPSNAMIQQALDQFSDY